jgi:O6-methylguanine-DNA--protein-cysteine methyltransferase
LPEGLSAAAVDTPVGRITLGATAQGVVRAVFDNHADVPALRETIRSRRGGQAAREHIAAAKAAISDFVAGRPTGAYTIDWSSIQGEHTLRATTSIPRAKDASYDRLDTPAGAEERGRVLGANPIVLLLPCHRVTRGREIPDEYVGGAERRRALRELERG